jgi:hypothetical protein
LALEQLRCGRVADSDEHAVEFALFTRTRFQVLDDDAGDAFRLFGADDFF